MYICPTFFVCFLNRGCMSLCVLMTYFGKGPKSTPVSFFLYEYAILVSCNRMWTKKRMKDNSIVVTFTLKGPLKCIERVQINQIRHIGQFGYRKSLLCVHHYSLFSIQKRGYFNYSFMIVEVAENDKTRTMTANLCHLSHMCVADTVGGRCWQWCSD